MKISSTTWRTALALVLVISGAVSLGYGYNPLGTESTVKYSQPLSYQSRSWINCLSFWWTLSAGDNAQLSLQLDPRLKATDVLFNTSIFQGIDSTTQQTAGLVRSWNITWALWKNYPNGIFTLNFTTSHLYNIRLLMYINADTSSITQPVLFYNVNWRDPSVVGSGEFLLAIGIALISAGLVTYSLRFGKLIRRVRGLKTLDSVQKRVE